MNLILETLVVGWFAANCYIVGCPATKEAMVIDPGDEPERILEAVDRLGVSVRCLVNTHGHADHIGADREVKDATGAPLYIHRLDAPLLADPSRNLSAWAGDPLPPVAPGRLLEDGDVIEVGEMSFRVIHTPGHTPGGICLATDGVVFSGDTLFAGSVGRTDFPGGSHAALVRSIKEKLLTLPDDTVVYPGHGASTTIGQEKAHNPFLQ